MQIYFFIYILYIKYCNSKFKAYDSMSEFYCVNQPNVFSVLTGSVNVKALCFDWPTGLTPSVNPACTGSVEALRQFFHFFSFKKLDYLKPHVVFRTCCEGVERL